MKTRVFTIFIFIIALMMSVLLLTSCSLFGKSDAIIPPTIKNVSMLKTYENYLESKEYLYNKDTENALAIESEGEFLISIEYDNPKKYAISYLNLNGEKIMSSKFETGSTRQKTIIKLKAPQATTAQDEIYEIKSIFYNAGSATKRLTFNKEIDMKFNVKVNPSYKMTLNYQNTDRRSSTRKAIDDVTTGIAVKFNETVSSYGVLNKDYTVAVGLPTKEGGWIFEGWFTQPHGKGILVQANDKYYFWSDIVLYAYFTRIFEYQIVELDEPIVHSYSGYKVGSSSTILEKGTKTFNTGVVITNDNTRGEYPKLDIYDTIVDEKVIVDKESGASTVTAVEYPVVKVGNKAFDGVNNIVELTIGKYVEEIGYYAFNNCNALKKTTFQADSRLKYIGDYAFQSTKSMGITDTFSLPESVVYLGNFAFRYSGWSNTTNNGVNESILHIYPRLKFIGFGCFMQTGFAQIIFEPGCSFESQISYTEGKETETNGGWTEIKPELNRIGGNLFAGCVKLTRVELLKDTEKELPALNIIPDRAFDGDRYNVKGMEAITFEEGLDFIGEKAFYYQTKIIELNMPNTLREIGKEAFYMCKSVINLNFKYGSQLEILRTKCFGNMANIDRVVITSDVFSRYGNGPFANCDRLKSVEFPNINDPSKVPHGYSEEEDEDEVMPFHYYSDLMFGTFESGSEESQGDVEVVQEKSSYSLPTRIFCHPSVIDAFRDSLVDGKEMYQKVGNGKVSTGRSSYQNVIFVNDITLVMDYMNPTRRPNEPEITKVALQEVYNMANAIVGYSIVYWSDRSKNITLPSIADFPTLTRPIIEISMYALPTSAETVRVPSSVTRLEHDAFNGCTNLTTVTFENRNTLQYIGDFAFFGTNITEFVGGTSLKVIGQNAFMKCKALRYVDLSNTSIINPPVNGRLQQIQTYKYAYEKTDKNNKIPNDYANTLYDGAFQGCVALSWVALPASLLQINNALFSGCVALRTVILYSTTVSDSTKETDKETFYANALPSSVYDKTAISFITIYVTNNTLPTHQKILEPAWIRAYSTIDDPQMPAHP